MEPDVIDVAIGSFRDQIGQADRALAAEAAGILFIALLDELPETERKKLLQDNILQVVEIWGPQDIPFPATTAQPDPAFAGAANAPSASAADPPASASTQDRAIETPLAASEAEPRPFAGPAEREKAATSTGPSPTRSATGDAPQTRPTTAAAGSPEPDRRPDPAPASAATNPAPGDASAAPTARGGANSPAGPGPTATSTASRTEPVEPPIRVEVNQTPREPNVLALPIGKSGEIQSNAYLVAIVMPKMRRIFDGNDLAWFLADNDENIALAMRTASASAIQDFEAAKKAQWEKIKELEEANA